jgi:hypothetical protein
MPIGSNLLRPVVATFTITCTAEFPVTATDEGDTVQADAAGAPPQASVTVPPNDVGTICIMNVAFWPAVTTIEFVAAASEKSGVGLGAGVPVPVRFTVCGLPESPSSIVKVAL